MGWARYGVYWLPGGALGAAGARWLGWDARAGHEAGQSEADAARPRRYGFHATVKAPFHLEGDPAAFAGAARELAAGLAPAELGRLRPAWLGRFLALVPEREPHALAAAVVEGLDRFRAPPTPGELARRRAADLSPREEEMLARWGYPHVMDLFRMHLTLTGPDPADATVRAAEATFAPLAGPHRIEALSLVGEDAAGRFHLIEDLPLGAHGAEASIAASASRTA